MLDTSQPTKKHRPDTDGAWGGNGFSLTDPGCERELNEDRCECFVQGTRETWMVCDGMGGVEGGELAAQLAIDAMKRSLAKHRDATGNVALKESILEAHRTVVLRRQNQVFGSMGTTVVAALIEANELFLAHVGDSRAYLVRRGEICPLTIDHTYVQELVAAGELDEEQMLDHPQAHVLTRCIGYGQGLEVDLQHFWISDNGSSADRDLLLLMTDGLYSLVSDGEVARIAGGSSPQEACYQLIELGKERGGFDNLSVAIVALPGQLSDAPPADFESTSAKRAVATKNQRGKATVSKASVKRMSRSLFFVVCLSGIAAAIALGLTVYLISL